MNAAVNQDWTTVPERSNRLMMRVMSWISLHFGRRASRVVLHLIAFYYLLFAPASRRASRDYLRRVLADGKNGRTPHWGDLYRHFFTFAATVHDRVYIANNRFDLFRLEAHGQAELIQLIAGGKGVFLFGAHLGSFDVVRALGRDLGGMRVAMVMHEGNARNLHATLSAINPHVTHDIIAMGNVDSMLTVSARLAEGYAIGFLADRTPGGETTRSVSFLGERAQLPVGPFRMAALLQRPVVFMTGLYMGGNRYVIHFEPIADFSSVTRQERDAAINAALDRYAALLDKYCRAAPYNWFNFFDFWPAADAAPAASTSP